MDDKLKAAHEYAGKDLKIPTLDGIGMGDAADLGDLATGFVNKIWNYKPT